MNAPGALRHSRGHRNAQVKLAAKREAKIREITRRLMGKQNIYAELTEETKARWAQALAQQMKKRSVFSNFVEEKKLDISPMPLRQLYQPIGLYRPEEGPIACTNSV